MNTSSNGGDQLVHSNIVAVKCPKLGRVDMWNFLLYNIDTKKTWGGIGY